MKEVAEDAAGGETGTGGGVIIRSSVVVNMAILFKSDPSILLVFKLRITPYSKTSVSLMIVLCQAMLNVLKNEECGTRSVTDDASIICVSTERGRPISREPFL